MWRFSLFLQNVAESEVFGYRGRLPRTAFLAAVVWRLGFSLLIYGLVQFGSWVVGMPATGFPWLLALLVFVVLVVPLTIRRFHDFGASAWIALMVLLVPWVPFLFAPWTDYNNTVLSIFLWWIFVVPVWFVAFACATLLIPSSKSNRYGPNLNA